MDTLTNLFSQYSIETIILLVLALGVSFKFIGELWEYFYNKIRAHFKYKSYKDKQHEDVVEKLDCIDNKIENISDDIKTITNEVSSIEIQLENTTERLQENTRSYIIDKHHHFVYNVGAIDDFNMQSLEKRYLFYRNAGGENDMYINNLIDEIRNLPRVSSDNLKVTEKEKYLNV